MRPFFMVYCHIEAYISRCARDFAMLRFGFFQLFNKYNIRNELYRDTNHFPACPFSSFYWQAGLPTDR